MTWPVDAQTYGSYQYLKREVGQFLGIGAEEDMWDHEQIGVVDSIVQRGLRRFYTPPRLEGEKQSHEWAFLTPKAKLTCEADYSTGTVTIVDGVVTLASGTFPSEGSTAPYAPADTWELTVSGGTYEVATRDGNTQITLDDTTLDVDAGTSYTLGFPAYILPSTYAMLEGPLTYQPGATTLYGPIEIVPEHTIRTRKQDSVITGRPELAAIYPKALDQTAGTRYLVTFWPTPDDAYVLEYRYRANPALLTNTNNLPFGGDPHAQTWVAAVLMEAELFKGSKNGPRRDHFYECLTASVDHDRRVNSPDFIGYNHDRSDVPFDRYASHHDWDQNIVTYNGVTY